MGINEYIMDIKPTVDWYLQQTGQELVGGKDTVSGASQSDNKQADTVSGASQSDAAEPEVDTVSGASSH